MALGIDTGLSYQNFHDLVFYLFLPILIFTAAYSIRPGELRRVLVPVASLAILGILVAASLIAVALYFGINHATGFPWHAALITGVLLAATDPAAVTSQAHNAHSLREERLNLVLEGESLFNDASSVVLFTVVLSLALMTQNGTDFSTSDAIRQGLMLFLKELGGGALVGSVCGLIYLAAIRLIPGIREAGYLPTWLSLTAALLAYHGALLMHASGVVGCLICGLMCAWTRDSQSKAAQTHSKDPGEYWQFAADTAGGVLFLLMGATITLSMFEERWLAMLIAIGAVIGARTLTVVLILRTTAR